MYTLKINNKVVDLQSNFNATLSYSTVDFLNPLDRTAGFTYSLTIPFTKNNNLIFNFINDDTVIDKFKVEEFDAVLEFNQNTLISGTFFLDAINENGFRGQIISDTLNWAKNIPDESVKNLTGFTKTFPLYNETYPNYSIEDSFNWYNVSANSKNSDFVLPFITYGNYNYAAYGQLKNNIQTNLSTPFLPLTAGTLFSWDDFFPCNFYVNSIKNIFTYMGYNIQCTLFESDELKNKVIAGSNKDFNWNWGELGKVIYDKPNINQDLTKSLQTGITVYTDFNFNVTDGTGAYTWKGLRYDVKHTGTLSIVGEINPPSRFLIFQSDEDYFSLEKIYDSVSFSTTSFNITGLSVTQADYLVLVTFDFDRIDNFILNYENEELNLNYQKTLPDISCKDYIKNFINTYNLYPYYNPQNNTVFLYTVDEFVQKDTDFILTSVNDFELKKYNNSSLELSYTYDPKDPLLIDREFDYGIGNTIKLKLLFSPTKTRTFLASTYRVGDNFSTDPVKLLSIASQEQINIDRLNLSLSDTIEYLPWDSTVTYNKGDKVSYNGVYWTSRFDTNLNNPPTNAIQRILIFNANWWVLDFIGEYNTDRDFDYTPRILEYKYDTNRISGYTGMTTRDYFIQLFPPKNITKDFFYFTPQTCEFTPDLDLTYIYNKYYKIYKAFINNRTSLLTGSAYIPVHYFIKFFNKPFEITYLSDTYILLGITNYNPITEIGNVQMIKKITLDNWQ